MNNFIFSRFMILCFFLIIFIQCSNKKNVSIELYQVYFDDRQLTGFGRRCYIQFYFLIINNANDSINVDEIGNRLDLIPDSINIGRKSNDFIYREFQPWRKHLLKRDSVFLMKRVDLELYPNTRIIRENLALYSEKSQFGFIPKVKYYVNPKLKYYFGDYRPYYMSKLDTLIARSIDDDISYYEGLLHEYLLYYN